MVSSPSSSSLKRQRQRVIVLGAGISGLACAKELQQRGYQVLVVEARQRIGGRLKGGVIETISEIDANVEQERAAAAAAVAALSTRSSVTTNGLSSATPLHVDLGGALIHGIMENPVHALVQQMGIPVQALSDTLLLDSNGWPIDAARDEKVSTLFNECLEESFRRISVALAARGLHTTTGTATQPRRRLLPLKNSHLEALAATQILPVCTDTVTPESDDAKHSACSPLEVPAAAPTAPPPPPLHDSSEEDDDDNYGHLFQRICRERNISTENNALWKWHQANLEVSCGTSFDQLGYSWNEDEAYGFEGDHVALSTSWKTVIDGLADGLDIVMGCPVTRICRVDANAWQAQRKAARTALISSPHQARSQGEPQVLPRQRPQSAPLAIARRSRRLLGEDVDLRRSTRATKGQLVEARLTVSSVSVWSYDDDTEHTQRSTADMKRRRLQDRNGDHEEELSQPTLVQVTLHDGTVLEADAVVCTLPLAILKIPSGKPGHIEFYPPLSDPKQSAIQKLGCGLLNKCALSFPRIFWQDVDFLGLASELRRPYLIINAAKYTTDHKPILIFMYGGAFAKEIEDWKDSDIVDDCMFVLRALYGQRDAVPDPLDYLVTRWGHEQFSRMAFTYVPPGVDGMQELERIRDPIYDSKIKDRPVIMFAGEHTTPYHPSTIHGAFLSGIREAYRLDLAMEPEANGNLKFEDDQLYQRTFAVRRKVRGSTVPNRVTSPAAFNANNGAANVVAKSKHRRRGIAGVMSLRRNPKTVLKEMSPPQPNDVVAASRRSQRSLAKRQLQVETDESSIPGKLERLTKPNPKVDLHALEDRMLVRGVESFGRDFAFIRSKVLPVHGSSRRKNPSQLRARYKTLTRTTPTSETKLDHVKETWKATEAFEPPIAMVESELVPEPMKTDGDLNVRLASAHSSTER